jgi:phosphoenolpyruvate carboxykinase (ATP)
MKRAEVDKEIRRISRIHRNPDKQTLRAWGKHQEQTTKHGHANYVSAVRNRSAKKTHYVQDEITLGKQQSGISREELRALYKKVLTYLRGKEVIQIDRRLGQHPDVHFHARLYVTKPYARIAYMWGQSLFEDDDVDAARDIISIFVPDWPEVKIVADPVERVTLILGSDYFGESKKSFLRMAMYAMKMQHNGLGLHAGSKQVIVKDEDSEKKEIGFILFGLSGTGKTSLTVHDYGLSGDEGVIIRQDDVVLMDQHGYCYGTERGFYIKTDGLNEQQKVLYQGAMHPESMFENVWVHDDGTIDFANQDLTSNGRGMILRETVSHTDQTIDLPKAHKVIFITRRDDIIPPVARLTPQQGAAFFMLGESIETSAGDPSKAGQSKREVGTNPFIIGPEEDEGNRFLEILKSNPDMECYLLNTGRVGKKDGFLGEKITVEISAEILKHLAYGDILWQRDPAWGYEVPAQVPGMDIGMFDPHSYYDEAVYQQLVEKLREERTAWLAQFPRLSPEIRDALAP